MDLFVSKDAFHNDWLEEYFGVSIAVSVDFDLINVKVYKNKMPRVVVKL